VSAFAESVLEEAALAWLGALGYTVHHGPDAEAPVSTYTVAREMGHGGEAMMRRVYGHLGQVRHRSEAVEYRVEQRAAKLVGPPP